MPTIPKASLVVGQTLHGFRVEEISVLDDLFLVAYRLVHEQTGARLLHFHGEDEENLFSINFPTPPGDDTGLPHIMEHAVLSGSERFPVRDPFFEMLKMSMATFINAMTGADCTYYPVCSNVRKDLFNLATVYFDAVFHPLLTEKTFKREGHHRGPADPTEPAGELGVNGIVYNEMKAAFSKPEARLNRISFRQLFTGTCYGFESGGDPVAIPDLTYDDFQAFHKRWYHPSNAHFVCYGSVETEAFLAFLEPRLASFTRQPIVPEFGTLARWKAPRQVEERYDIGDEPPEARTYHQLNWQVPLGADLEATVLMEVLGTALLGDDAAPLKKAIIDSGLGSDLMSSGLGTVGRDAMFCVGLRGSEADRAEAFRNLVLDVMARIAREGLEPERIEAAFLQHSYALREIGSNQPLQIAFRALEPWIQGDDPLLSLRLQTVFDACREACRRDPMLLSRLLDEKLIKNPHRLDVCLVPDAAWGKETEGALRKRMADERAALDDEAMQTLAAEALALQKEAGTANTPEALATLPQLAHSDLPERPSFIPTEVERLSTGNRFLRNDVFSNGINYLELHIDLEGLPESLWGSVPRYVEALTRLGAAGQDFARMAERTVASTGHFNASVGYMDHFVEVERVRKGIVISIKALDEQMAGALDVLADRLLRAEPGDPDRFKDVLNQRLSRMQTGLVNGGPSTALTHIRAGLTETGYLQELTSGVSQLHAVQRQLAAWSTSFSPLVEAIEQIHAVVMNRRRFTVSFTGSDRAAEQCRTALESWLSAMPDDEIVTAPTGFVPAASIERVGLAGPMQVAHCTQILPALHRSHPESSLLVLAMAMLRVDYMVSELRFKGNAYGASCSYDGRSINLSTYADPHIKRTLDVFRGLPEYVRDVPWGEIEVTRGILSAAKQVIRPIRPMDATRNALLMHLRGETESVQSEHYDVLRRATPDALKRALLKVLETGFRRAPVAVLSNREKLETANAALGAEGLQIAELLD
jgi:presequence protease